MSNPKSQKLHAPTSVVNNTSFYIADEEYDVACSTSSAVNCGCFRRMVSRSAPDAIHSKIMATLIRVPRMIGFPPRIAESDVMRSNMRGLSPEKQFVSNRDHSRSAFRTHSEAVAGEHHLHTTETDFQKATQNPTQSGTEMSETDGKAVIRPLVENEKSPEFPGLSTSFRLLHNNPVTRPGFEPGQTEPKSVVLPLHYRVPMRDGV